MIQSNSTASVNYLQYDWKKQRCNKKKKTTRSGNSLGQQQVSYGSNPKHGKFQTHMKGKICFRCGKQPHQQGQKCSAMDKTYKACGKMDHFEVVCQTKLKSKNQGSL